MTGKKIIEGAREALAVARGEQPAARITINGHAYVPEARVAELTRVVEKSIALLDRRAVELDAASAARECEGREHDAEAYCLAANECRDNARALRKIAVTAAQGEGETVEIKNKPLTIRHVKSPPFVFPDDDAAQGEEPAPDHTAAIREAMEALETSRAFVAEARDPGFSADILAEIDAARAKLSAIIEGGGDG